MLFQMFKFSNASYVLGNTAYTACIKEAMKTTVSYPKYVVNEPNFETLINKMAQYKNVAFNPQYFEGYTINRLENYNKLEEDKTKRFIIDCPHFKKCTFVNAHILKFKSRSGMFEDCNFTNSVFKECRFHSNVFLRCNFTGATFHTYTDGTGANISFSECVFDNSKINIEGINSRSGDDSYTFRNCSLKNTDMGNCTFLINKVTFKNCDTSGAKFKNCKINELDSDYLFRLEFLIKGGEILNNPSVIDKSLSWIGQHINLFC